MATMRVLGWLQCYAAGVHKVIDGTTKRAEFLKRMLNAAMTLDGANRQLYSRQHCKWQHDYLA